jgi:hypothetical protein
VTYKQTNHENLTERDDVKIGLNCTFGFVFAIVALLPVLAGSGQHKTARVWAIDHLRCFCYHRPRETVDADTTEPDLVTIRTSASQDRQSVDHGLDVFSGNHGDRTGDAIPWKR